MQYFNLRSGPQKEWRQLLHEVGWFRTDQSRKSDFDNFANELNDVRTAYDGDDLLALDIGYFDPNKNVGDPERVVFLSPFIRPIRTLDAIEHLKGTIKERDGNGGFKQAGYGKLAEILLSALVDKTILQQTGDSYCISEGKRRDLKDIPPNDVLQANNGIVATKDFDSCGIEYQHLTDGVEVIDGHVVDFDKANLDEDGLIQLAIIHKGPDHSLVPLAKLDKWGIKETTVLANIFETATSKITHSNASLNGTRDSVILELPNAEQLMNMKQGLETRLKELNATIEKAEKKDERLSKAIDREQYNRVSKERDRDQYINEGKIQTIQLLAMQVAMKHMGDNSEEKES